MESFGLLPKVAREAIRARFERRAPRLPAARGALAEAHAVFVTLRIAEDLRGCIGSLEPLHGDLVAETADRACAAAFEDPRFPALRPPELDRCRIEVSVLGELEAVHDDGDLDPAHYGIVVADAAGRRGVLLPAIPGVQTVTQQLEITRRKAGIPAGEPASIWRFRVDKAADAR